ncbi:MAG: hypothetical protein Q4Q06_04580 [Bacteroidota bacterium]|nr:hypothetical protein [Bacteroidota bacterium]
MPKEKPVLTKLIGNVKSVYSIKEDAPIITPKQEEEGRAFNIDEVTKNLIAYATSFSEDANKVDLYFAINHAKISSEKDFIVDIKVKTSADVQTLNKYKMELTQFLKNKLSYKFVKIEIEFENTQQNTHPTAYNPMDKYLLVSKANPSVAKLKDAFDAEITY